MARSKSLPPVVSTAIVVAVCFTILLIPRLHTVSAEGWRRLGIFAATILGLIFQPIPGGALVLIAVTLSTLLAGITALRRHARAHVLRAGYVAFGAWWRIGFIVSLPNLFIRSTVGMMWWKYLGIW